MSFFSEMLRKLRADKGITQAQLAKEIGVSKSSINMYERGEREPSYSTLQKISQYFNISTDALLGNEVFINNLAEAGKSMRKTLREIALEHHFIDNYGYEHFSDMAIFEILQGVMENDNVEDALRLELTMEVMLATMELHAANMPNLEEVEESRKKLIDAIKRIRDKQSNQM